MTYINYKGQEPFYIGWEIGATGRILGRSWFHEVDPPYRAGKAVRIRLGSRAIHLGICGRAKRPVIHDTDTSIEEIKRWVYD